MSTKMHPDLQFFRIYFGSMRRLRKKTLPTGHLPSGGARLRAPKERAPVTLPCRAARAFSRAHFYILYIKIVRINYNILWSRGRAKPTLEN